MRVGLVCPYSLTLPGGVQGQVLGLGRALRGLGVDARVLGPCDGPPPEPAITPLGNSVPQAANGSMAAIAPDPAAALRTIRALRDEAFDVVHLHEPLVPGPTLTAMMFSDGPLVGTFHRAGEGLWYRTARAVTSLTVDRLTVRAAVSSEAMATAERVLGGHYELVWNGIDQAAYESAEPWPADRPTVLFVGRHEARKGLAVLLDALAYLGDDVRLWVAGEGPETERLRQASSGDGRVEWLGVISDAEKRRRLRAASVLCAPSLHGESFGVVLLEAMAAGVPVVASDLSGYRRVARADQDAVLVPPGDEAALAGALKEALGGGDVVATRVASASQRAATFSMDALAHRYLELYGQAVRAAKRQVRRPGRARKVLRARLGEAVHRG
ncbi:MAG: glycosyltransferase family 4 protein [Acidimicrobiaceae bacterium]|nr:glycosyltransferase family 4 protein [Acidimicrobiaceae bacterium]